MHSNNRCPVVIFGDIVAAYGVIRALSLHDIPMHMVSPDGKGWATRSRFVRSALTLHPFDADFASKLDQWIHDEVGGSAVLMVAGSDQYLDVLSKQYSQLRGDIRVTFPDWETVRLVREKRHTYRLAEEVGIPVPKTAYVSSRSELESVLHCRGTGLSYPVLMKPEDSVRFKQAHGKKGVLCYNADQMVAAFGRYSEFEDNLLVQEFIPGEESSVVTAVMVLNRTSDPIGFMINRKKRVTERFLGCTAVQTTWSDEVLEHSRRLTRRIGYYGYTGNQFKLDPRDGLYKLMEINGRITMSNSLALRLAVNLPYLMYKEAIDGPLPQLVRFKQKTIGRSGVLWMQYPVDIVSLLKQGDIRALFGDYLCRKRGSGRIVEPLNWRDPLPALHQTVRLLTALSRKLRRSEQ